MLRGVSNSVHGFTSDQTQRARYAKRALRETISCNCVIQKGHHVLHETTAPVLGKQKSLQLSCI